MTQDVKNVSLLKRESRERSSHNRGLRRIFYEACHPLEKGNSYAACR